MLSDGFCQFRVACVCTGGVTQTLWSDCDCLALNKLLPWSYILHVALHTGGFLFDIYTHSL